MRRRTVFAAAIAACLTFVAPALHAQAPEKSKVAVGVGGKTLFYYLPLTIAERNGYFKAEGLDVVGSTPEQAAATMESELKKYAVLIRERGMKAE